MNAVRLPERAPERKDAATGSARLGRRVRWTMAVGLVLLAMVAGVVLAVSYPRERAFRDEVANRAAVVRVAERFTTLANNYDAASIDGYQKSIAPLLTTKFRSDFRKAMRDLVASVKKSNMNSHGQVLASAVSGIDQDSATALVVADAKVTSIYDTRARHFRWKVSLVKVNGHWLVDDFQPVG